MRRPRSEFFFIATSRPFSFFPFRLIIHFDRLSPVIFFVVAGGWKFCGAGFVTLGDFCHVADSPSPELQFSLFNFPLFMNDSVFSVLVLSHPFFFFLSPFPML